MHLFLHRNPYPMPTAIARLIKGCSSHTQREPVPLGAMHVVRLDQEHVLQSRRRASVVT
jgi:hypothetical protein